MPSYPLRALVLRKTKLGEADLIVTLLAADGRQVRAVAKGVRKTKSRLGARVELFTVTDLLLHTGRSLEVIAEAETLASHEGIREDYDRTAAASVVTDVLDKVSQEGQTEPQVFDMALVTLDVMEVAPVGSLRSLVLAFLVKSLAMHGYRPSLDACAACAREDDDAHLFSPRTGGVLCRDCGDTDPGALPMSRDARAALRALMRTRMAEVPDLAVPPGLEDELMRLVLPYVAYHVPARLKALEMFVRGPSPVVDVGGKE
ncbi:MAG TPA: DNA repair protein RecO [Coriobacteriia bacterium]